ncbi:MAG: glycogen synthase [Thermoleophilaceae bacterium]|nr:glycogen synthase [Thermoleophilaceae bacterium]MEA2471089.1 glycogen synthase [Thermoleophilaceae bacterium]
MALMFFPRGGSAQVARYVARALPGAGWDVTLVAGSLGDSDEASNAEVFFKGVEDLRTVDYTAARDAPDPLAADPPFQPSFEDRTDAPDRVFASVSDEDFERLVSTWEGVLGDAGAADADVLHLNHLTPMNEAAARSFPDVPVIGHLHGTELLMLKAIEDGPPEGWTHASAWAERMRAWAQRCERLLVLSPDAVERVPALLDVDPERVIWAPNGFEPDAFDRRPKEGAERRELWRRWLVEEPRGWDPDQDCKPGTVRYHDDDLDLLDGTVLVYSGRYTEVKRLPLLIRAFARAWSRFDGPAALVLIGGYPGEWEGEHPLEVVRSIDARGVFLAGWRGHDDLPDGLNASDAVVLPSVHEQFGQVLVEGMACGLPCVAVDAHGPATIVDDGSTGWLVPPDDEDAMADALVEVVNDPDERRSRGEAAYGVARERYSWPALVEKMAAVYEEVRGGS